MEYLVFCDTETGGLDNGQPILQIAWHVATTGGLTVKRENHYMMPADWSNVSAEALAVNGLTKEVLQKHIDEQGYQITIDQAAAALHEDIEGYNARFVAYNAPFDARMILSNIKHDTATLLFNHLHRNHIDVMQPAMDALKSDRWLSLVKAYTALTGLQPDPNAHEAEADIFMTRAVYQALRERQAI